MRQSQSTLATMEQQQTMQIIAYATDYCQFPINFWRCQLPELPSGAGTAHNINCQMPQQQGVGKRRGATDKQTVAALLWLMLPHSVSRLHLTCSRTKHLHTLTRQTKHVACNIVQLRHSSSRAYPYSNSIGILAEMEARRGSLCCFPCCVHLHNLHIILCQTF